MIILCFNIGDVHHLFDHCLIPSDPSDAKWSQNRACAIYFRGRRVKGGGRGDSPPHGHKFYEDNIIKTNIKLDNRKKYIRPRKGEDNDG